MQAMAIRLAAICLPGRAAALGRGCPVATARVRLFLALPDILSIRSCKSRHAVFEKAVETACRRVCIGARSILRAKRRHPNRHLQWRDESLSIGAQENRRTGLWRDFHGLGT